jgi:mercuric ion transport protein
MAAGIGAALLVIVCCAGPALIAAGVLGAIGGVLGNPWMIAAAIVVLVAAVTTVVRRRRPGRKACCPPAGPLNTPAAADRDRPHVPADQEGPRSR